MQQPIIGDARNAIFTILSTKFQPSVVGSVKVKANRWQPSRDKAQGKFATMDFHESLPQRNGRCAAVLWVHGMFGDQTEATTVKAMMATIWNTNSNRELIVILHISRF
mmetsp:Transcript_28441/g.46590  ORF Transcript_28441/g.46590 Transcript_28441/m.46590 type:complete len:108 (+) Transcript_28441:146-469(+)